ncbi:hypothetical protein P5V15_011059 [Pogonomyrmex californicus]
MQPHESRARSTVPSARRLRLDGGIWRCLCVLVYLLSLADTFSISEPPIVYTKWGLLRGKWSWSTYNRPIANFLGIPYAQPPWGELRFKSPQPWNHTWMTIRDATIDGQKCIQITRSAKLIGSEDCLYLNIFVPDILGIREKSEKLPVLVFVHGGGYFQGSSDSNLYAPDYLLNHDVILVTMNYRLHALGFFSTTNKISPGNYGIKDIKMALEWVQENIHSFEGNPKSVTLMGSSAGAALIHFLVMSKKTENLFHRYILQSGTALSSWIFFPRKKYRQQCLKLAKLVGCLPKRNQSMIVSNETITESPEEEDVKRSSDDILYSSYTIKDDEEIITCMRWVDAEELVKMTQSFYVWRSNPWVTFMPTLEDDSEDAILTVQPLKIIKEGLFRDIPAIIQTVKDESLFKTVDLIINPDLRDEFIENFEKYFPVFMEQQNVITNTTFFASAIQDFYFNGNMTMISAENITEMMNDLITWSLLRVAKYQSETGKSNIYFAFFAYRGTLSHTFATGTPISYGVCHGDDLNYLFPILNNVYQNMLLRNTEDDITMINIMTEMLANFVKKGIPRARLIPEWPAYRDHHQFMRFGIDRSPDIVVEADFRPDRMKFWEKLMSTMEPLESDTFVDEPSKDAESASNANTIDRQLIVTFIALSAIIFL